MTAPMLTRARAEQMPLPEGVTTFGISPAGGCRICGGNRDINWPVDLHLLTCSVTVNAQGLHDLQSHQIWCPVIVTSEPPVGCPRCGAEVRGYEYTNGFKALVEGSYGSETIVGSSDEIFNDPRIRFGSALGPKMKPEPAKDVCQVEPCGHVLEGSDAHTVRAGFAQMQKQQHEQDVAQVLAEHADLLDTASRIDPVGFAVAAKYREAVRTGSRDASGLLAALKAMAGR